MTPAKPSVADKQKPARKPLELVTLLNDACQLTRVVTPAHVAAWRTEIADKKTAPRRKELLRLWIAEYTIGHLKEPMKALEIVDRLVADTPKSSHLRGQILADQGWFQMLCGMYVKSAQTLSALLKSGLDGYDQKLVVGNYRHAQACADFHATRAAAGITEPTHIDPLCGANSIAVALRHLGLRHDKPYVSSKTPHTGFGSNLEELQEGARNLGLDAYPIHFPIEALPEIFKLSGGVPMVARVEHDHWVAVYSADKEGVTYLCSDCGPWPGGSRTVTWSQWQLMEPDSYLAMGMPDSEFVQALRDLPSPRDGKRLEANEVEPNATVLALRNALVQQQTIPIVDPWTHTCGVKPWCDSCKCPVDCPEMASAISVTKDPVNLATGSESYVAPGGLTVYNPTGPAVNWTHAYESLGRTFGNGWGSGWYHPYMTTIELVEVNPMVGPCYAWIYLPNTGRISVNFGDHSAPPSTGQTFTGAVEDGFPYLAAWKNESGTEKIVITTASRTVYEFLKKDTHNSTPNRSQWYLSKITDRMGKYITLEWSAMTFATYNWVMQTFDGFGLTAIKDSSGSALLTLHYDAVHDNRLVEVEDRYDRHIYYEVDTFSGTHTGPYQDLDQLTKASVIVDGSASAPYTVQFEYDYDNVDTSGGVVNDEGVPLLTSISTISPTGTGYSTATISYGNYAFVEHTIDANGNKTEITYGAGSGMVTVRIKNPSNQTVGGYIVKTTEQMGWSEIWNLNDDVTGSLWGKDMAYPLISKVYASASPFKPSKIRVFYDNPAYPTDPSDPPSVAEERYWDLTWDDFSQLVSITSPKGITKTITRDYNDFALGKVEEVETEGQTSTLYFYDEPTGLLEEVQSPIPGEVNTGNRQSTTFAHNTYGDITQIVAPGNNAGSTKTVTVAYDGTPKKGQPITVTDPNGNITEYTYTDHGLVETVEDADGHISEVEYNIANQVVKSLLPATGNTGAGQSYTLNDYLFAGGYLMGTEAYNENNTLVRYSETVYGDEGEILSQKYDGTTLTTYTYDGAYRTKTIKDGLNQITSYEYDVDGHLTEVDYPGSTSTNFDQVHLTSYDRQGNLLAKTDGRGQVVGYVYGDDDGLLTEINYTGASSQDVTIAYDDYGRPISITDGEGSGTSEYDDLDLVTEASRTYTGLSAKTFTYSYYPDGSRDTLSTPAGDWEYLYDIGGRTTSLVSPAGTHTIDYADNNWITKRTLPNGTYTDYAYNAIGLPTSITNKSSGGTTQTSFGSFSYDGVFNMLGVTAAYTGASSYGGDTDWTYDSKDRLTNETSTRSLGWNHTNAFDNAFNPTTFKGNTLAYNSDNQVTTGSMTYDGNGNPTTYGGTSMTYDVENRITAVGSSLTCGYRADNLRAWKQGSTGGKTYFLYDGGIPIIEMNSSGAVANINVFAPDGLVGRKEGSTWTYYTFDQQGNVAQRLDASQNVVSNRVVDAWGSGTESGSRMNDCWTYNGKWGYYYDRETSLYYCQNRMYDATRGRWINRDPIGYAGGINLYGYCGGAPTGALDPSGLQELTMGDPARAGTFHYPRQLGGLGEPDDPPVGFIGPFAVTELSPDLLLPQTPPMIIPPMGTMHPGGRSPGGRGSWGLLRSLFRPKLETCEIVEPPTDLYLRKGFFFRRGTKGVGHGNQRLSARSGYYGGRPVSAHAMQRIYERQLPPMFINELINHGDAYNAPDGTIHYSAQGVTAIVNSETGVIITVK